MKITTLILLLFCLLSVRRLAAQQFSGMKGSVYNAVMNTSSQPAAGANMPNSWGIEIVGVNTFWNNNIVDFSPLKFEWTQDTIDVHRYLIPGKSRRWGTENANVHLLNFLFHVPQYEKWVIGAGWNIRTNGYAGHLRYDYADSMSTVSRFLKANAVNKKQQGLLMLQQWMEWFVNASTVIQENKFEKWTAGASLKLTKGMNAEVADIQNLQLKNIKPGTPGGFALARIYGHYGYSANLDKMSDSQSTNKQIHEFANGSPLSFGLDVGVTYTRKKPIWIAGFTNDDPADYKWKISLALTDFGRLKYVLGKGSRVMNGIKNTASLDDLEQSLSETSTLEDFNDSLGRVVDIAPWEGKVSMSLPTRFQIGFDKNMGRHFFLHAHLVLDASFLNPRVDYKMHTVNHIVITPRWEIKHFGIYAPLYLNGRGAFLAGAAIRLGPLVAGVHDFGWLFDHTRSGGAYVALTIKNFYKEREDCPTF